nr:zinc finger protein STAMENLESS 1-like [Ipomoea batatas]
MASEAIAEIEELIKVEEVGEGDLQVGAAAGRQTGFLHPRFLCSPLAGFPPLSGGGHWYQAVAAAKPPCFLPGNSIPSPEISTGARSPYAHLFPPQVVNGHSLLAQVSPPAMIFPGGGNAFPGGSVPANNSPITAEDGELDLTLGL